MSLFGDLDIAGASDDPFGVPDDTYSCVVSDFRVGRTKDESKKGATIVYKVMEGEQSGEEIQEWKRIPSKEDPEPLVGKAAEKAISYLKLRLADLGIPESRMNDTEKEDIIGLECYVSTRKNNGYVNVRKVTVEAPEDGVSAEANPFG